MDEGMNRSDWRVQAGLHEEGISKGHMQVRQSLRSLPLRSCPVGFEFRLQKRLEGGFVAVERSAGHRWTVAWAGLGLGVATAAAIAIFAFDFSGTVPVQKNANLTASQGVIEQREKVATKTATPTNLSQQSQEPVTRTVIETPPQVASAHDKAVDTKQDSLNKLKSTTTQDFPAQVVSSPSPK